MRAGRREPSGILAWRIAFVFVLHLRDTCDMVERVARGALPPLVRRFVLRASMEAVAWVNAPNDALV